MDNAISYILDDVEVDVKYDYQSMEPATQEEPGIGSQVEVYSVTHEGEEIIGTVSNEDLEQIEMHILENIE